MKIQIGLKSWLVGCTMLVMGATGALAETVYNRGNAGDPSSLDPHKTSTVQEANILRDLFEGLASFNSKGEVIPGAAESWTPSADAPMCSPGLWRRVFQATCPPTSDPTGPTWGRLHFTSLVPPGASIHMELRAAELAIREASWRYDQGLPCGEAANTAKFLAAEAGYAAADQAVQTHGGMGYASEYHVERYWREARLMRLAPVSQELVQAYVATHVLGLPRSY